MGQERNFHAKREFLYFFCLPCTILENIHFTSKSCKIAESPILPFRILSDAGRVVEFREGSNVMKTNISTISAWNGLDGLINDKPFLPGATPAQKAAVLMELAEQDGERLGVKERGLIITYAEAVRDCRQVSDLIAELRENAYEMQHGHVDPEMEGFVQREIAAAWDASEKIFFASAAM